MVFFSDPQKLLNETPLVDRFLAYVKIDTRSDPSKKTTPSTETQFDLAGKLKEELLALGLEDASVDARCYVTATLPGNVENPPCIGFLAHLDTSPSVSGAGVMPLLHRKYDGSPIKLRDGVVIAAKDSPELQKYIGDTIITSDGTTLLGADDKAGIAIIMSAVEYLTRHPEVPRPTIKVAFTPDEEIGRGVDAFPLASFGAEVAYTIDGSFEGEINLETFEAHEMIVTFKGVSTHPGTAKGKLVNALKHMAAFLDRLPRELCPEETEAREGFIQPVECSGDTSECACKLILRDFEESGIGMLDKRARSILESIAGEEPRLGIEVAARQTYPNMLKYLSGRPDIRLRLEEAVRLSGVEPVVVPIRGGTDGATLTRMGLPCPNIFSGGMSFHDKREWVAAGAMGRSLCAVLNLAILHTR